MDIKTNDWKGHLRIYTGAKPYSCSEIGINCLILPASAEDSSVQTVILCTMTLLMDLAVTVAFRPLYIQGGAEKTGPPSHCKYSEIP